MPAPTGRQELRRERPASTGTPTTCGWVTGIALPGGNDNQRGHMPLTCAPGQICGSVNGMRGCCDDVAECPAQIAVECYDSNMISTASPTTGPVLYCSDPVRPSCIEFYYSDNFYTSWACGPSDLYDVGTYFEAIPGSLAPSTAFDRSEVVTTFTSYLKEATPAAVTTSSSSSDGGTGSGFSVPNINSWPVWGYVVMAFGIVLVLLLGFLPAIRRWRNNGKQMSGKQFSQYPFISEQPTSMHLYPKTTAAANVHEWQQRVGPYSQNSHPNMPPTPPRTTCGDDAARPDDDAFSSAQTGYGSEHHGRMHNFE